MATAVSRNGGGLSGVGEPGDEDDDDNDDDRG